MKRLTQLALALAVGILPGVSPTPLWAQEDEGRSPEQKVEVSFHFGGALNHRMSFLGVCREIVEDGCSADSGEFDGETTDVFFATAGRGLTAHSGFQFGLRLGFDLNPRWQLEFTWDHVLADLAFHNESLLLASISTEASFADPPDETFTLFQSGSPQGDMNIYQFNLNYHTRSTGKVIPYVGAGAGWVQFRNPPMLDFENRFTFAPTFSETERGSVRLNEDVAPAFNFGGGVKIFPTKHFGFRLDIRQLFSFYKDTHEVRSFRREIDNGVDFEGFEEVSADFDQKSTFSHFMLTAGILFRF
ncbi:MAG: hypothetical protein ACE5MH_01250 [Terriglobia bacterium]